MITFNSYEHFKKYCFKIAHNKEIKLTNQQYEVFDKFESVVEFLEHLRNSNRIEFKNCVLNKIVELFKKGQTTNATDTMDYLIRKISKFKNGEVDIYYVFTSFNSMLGMDIQFTEEFINKKNIDDVFFPSKIRVLEIVEETEKIYSISTNGFDMKGIFGVYFIYDNQGVLAYIGKSSSCAISRSFSSAKERDLLDFSKIEIRATKTKSDLAIYEAYYISKYKPYCNTEHVFEDETTLVLPELEIVKTFERDIHNDYFEFKYRYVRSRVYDSKLALDKLNKSIFLENEKNKTLLENKGYLDRYSMRQKAYENCLKHLIDSEYQNVADVSRNMRLEN